MNDQRVNPYATPNETVKAALKPSRWRLVLAAASFVAGGTDFLLAINGVIEVGWTGLSIPSLEYMMFSLEWLLLEGCLFILGGWFCVRGNDWWAIVATTVPTISFVSAYI